MVVTQNACPYRLDLVTLLVSDLQGACKHYEQILGLTHEESGVLPDPLALRLGLPSLKGAAYAGMVGDPGSARLRLIACAAADQARPSNGWRTLIYVDAQEQSAEPSDSDASAQLDPENHELLIHSSANRASSLRSVSLESDQAAGDAAFYQGLIGASVSNGLESSKRLGLNGFGSIDLVPPTVQHVLARPLAVRLSRSRSGNEAIPQLTALARCLRGPQDEIIELI